MSTETLSKSKTHATKPPHYKVVLLNDDYTPMEFVVFVLMRYFHKSETEAMQLMLEAHQKGSSTAGVYPFEIAETKVKQVLRVAAQEGHPLSLDLEPE